MTGRLHVVIVTADSPEEAWRNAARLVHDPHRWKPWSASDLTLARLLGHLRRGTGIAHAQASIAGVGQLPRRQSPGSAQWFTPVART